jgi:hypothetical protein
MERFGVNIVREGEANFIGDFISVIEILSNKALFCISHIPELSLVGAIKWSEIGEKAKLRSKCLVKPPK